MRDGARRLSVSGTGWGRGPTTFSVGEGWGRTVYGEGLYLLQIPRKTRSRSTSNAADTKLERRFRLLSLSAGVFGGFCGGSEANKAPPRTPVCDLLMMGLIIWGSHFFLYSCVSVSASWVVFSWELT